MKTGQLRFSLYLLDRQRTNAREEKLTHLLVHQPERQRLVSNEGLIVTFGVGDALLAVPSVDEGVDDVAHVPVVVALGLLEELDPHVGNGHRQSVVEPDAARGNVSAEGRHAGDVLGDGDGRGVEGVDHRVGLTGKGGDGGRAGMGREEGGRQEKDR
jgi:hypothetical protein